MKKNFFIHGTIGTALAATAVVGMAGTAQADEPSWLDIFGEHRAVNMYLNNSTPAPMDYRLNSGGGGTLQPGTGAWISSPRNAFGTAMELEFTVYTHKTSTTVESDNPSVLDPYIEVDDDMERLSLGEQTDWNINGQQFYGARMADSEHYKVLHLTVAG